MQDVDKEPTNFEKLADLVATMKACGSYTDVKVMSADGTYAVIEAQWINTNYGKNPAKLEKIRMSVLM